MNVARHGRGATPPDGETGGCDFSITHERKPIQGREPLKKNLERMILKWHEDGITLDETARLVPQVPKAGIAAIIHRHDKETIDETQPV